MEPQEHIQRAEKICQRLRNATAQIGPQSRSRSIRGADPNELKKIYAYLLKHRDLNALKKLINKLPGSTFARRTGSTQGYLKNIQSTLGPDFYSLPVDDAIFILGWVCRML
jgi:hypothetical protein